MGNSATSQANETPPFCAYLLRASITKKADPLPPEMRDYLSEAVALEQQARALRERHEARERDRFERNRVRRRKSVIRALADAARAGADNQALAGELARKLDLTLSDAAETLRFELTTRRRVHRARRDRLICLLAQRGWTNQEIGDDPRVTLKPKTVSRIISLYLVKTSIALGTLTP